MFIKTVFKCIIIYNYINYVLVMKNCEFYLLLLTCLSYSSVRTRVNQRIIIQLDIELL
jgi:hypothetical protein